MPASIPPVLAPYFQSCVEHESLTLVTSVLNTPANWLVLRFIKAVLSGVDEDAGARSTPLATNTSVGGDVSVTFLSFVQSYEFWVELGKRIGLDIPALTSRKQLAYIDGLNTVLNVPRSATSIVHLKSHSLPEIKSAIAAANSVLAGGHALSRQSILVIDGLDFILASQPDITAAPLIAFITEARESCTHMVLSASADSPLLHNIEASATPLELQHSIFVRSIAHQSAWLWQLRPLETGHANDVSGVIQISKGGADTAEDDALPDGEWLYQVKGDGSVRAWSRGE